MKKSDYQKMKIYRDALKAILRQLEGIDADDLERSEENIQRIAKSALAKAAQQ